MQKNYSYPLDLSWSTEELASVLSFFNKVEEAYESKVEAKEYMEAYRAFKKVVPSIGEEKRLGREFATQKIEFLRRKMAFVHRFQKDPFG